MADLSLRQYRSGDDERIRELHEEAMDDAGALVEDDPEFEAAIPDDVELDADLDAIAETYLEPGGAFLVGCVERGSTETASGQRPRASDEIVAMGALRPVDDAMAELKRMRVDPDHQRRGYGQQVLEALEADRRGFSAIVLDALARQESARAFYETNGYRETDREQFGGYEVCFYWKALGE